MKVSCISKSEYDSYYQIYIDKIPKEKSLGILFQENKTELLGFLNDLPEEKLNFRYAQEKWSIAEMLQHILDVERVFQYRALRFSRKDQTPLSGFDHDAFIMSSNAGDRDLASFLYEFEMVRGSTVVLYTNFDKEMLQAVGSVESSRMSVRAIGFILVGHVKHHLAILKERYR